nr:hypothetical protein [Tanacetum cinerariifolium]
MPTKIELTLEQSQQGVSNDILETNAILLIIKIMMVDLLPLEMVKAELWQSRQSTKKKRVINSGCSWHMTGNKCYLTDYKDYDGGFASFRDGKGRIMAKLLDESKVLLRVQRKDNKYSVDLKSVVPAGGLTCLFAKATIDESNLWHRRLGHTNYKIMNKLVKGNLMVLKPVLKTMKKKIGQREVRPVWNHAMRVNHQNFSISRRNFAPTAGLTKSGIVPISTARPSSSRVAAPVSTTRPINTVAPKPVVNVAKSRQNDF